VREAASPRTPSGASKTRDFFQRVTRRCGAKNARHSFLQTPPWIPLIGHALHPAESAAPGQNSAGA